MRRTLPGEIWLVDFGLAAKTRPALVLSDYPEDNELALLVVSRIRLRCAAIVGNSACQSHFSRLPEYSICSKFNPFRLRVLKPGWER